MTRPGRRWPARRRPGFQAGGIGEQLVQGGCGPAAGPGRRRPALRRGGDRCATCVSTQGCRTSEVRRARRQRAVRCRIRAACNGAHLAHRAPPSRQAGRAAGSGRSSGWSWQRPFFFFSAREKKRNEKKTGEWVSCGQRRSQRRRSSRRRSAGQDRPPPAGSPPSTTCSRTPVAVAYSAASRANRPGPHGRRGQAGRWGVLGGVLEHRLDLGDVDDVDVQGPRAGRLRRHRP